jgi:hypothetical protein
MRCDGFISEITRKNTNIVRISTYIAGIISKITGE